MKITAKISNYMLDNFVAPEISKLTENNVIDLSEITQKSECWISNFILNSTLRYKIVPPDRQYILNILRKAQASLHEYENARFYLTEYIEGEREVISRYFKSLLHLEYCMAQAYQAFLLVRNFAGLEKLFEKNDGSDICKLNQLYNESKHMENSLASGQIPDSNTLPVWLTNHGIKSNKTLLTFEELNELLIILSEIAQKYSNLA